MKKFRHDGTGKCTVQLRVRPIHIFKLEEIYANFSECVYCDLIKSVIP